MKHQLFKPKSFEEGKDQVIGECNGIPMQTRWEVETPAFAKEILKYYRPGTKILDYGCGVGRLSKQILLQNPLSIIDGIDSSNDMMKLATAYVNNPNFHTLKPENLKERYSVIYLIYVLQHVPAIEIREVLARIHHHLTDDGFFICCSSDFRMSIRFDQVSFFDDGFLGINLQKEIGRLFNYQCELFDEAILNSNQVLKTMIHGELTHPARVYTKKNINDYLHIGNPE